MSLVVITQPVVLPVTVAEVKAHAVIEHSLDDALIEQYIKAFTAYGQNRTGRQFVATTMELRLDSFPLGSIDLAPELQSIVSIKYTDADGYEDVVDVDEYTVVNWSISPVNAWPDSARSVKIKFVSGWPATGDGTEEFPYTPTTPEDIKAWIMVRVAGIYEQRENFVLSKSGGFGVSEMPKDFIDFALDLYAVPVVP